MDVFEAIKGRRSIRRFKKDPVPDELILKVIDAARWAPSSKNKQPWEFIVIRDEETKRPRINKPGSYMDRRQREEGEYYYSML